MRFLIVYLFLTSIVFAQPNSSSRSGRYDIITNNSGNIELSPAGNINIPSGDLNLSDGDFTVSGAATVTGQLNAGSVEMSDLSVSGSATVSGSFDSNSISTQELTVQSNATMQGSFNVSGVSDLSATGVHNLTIDGSLGSDSIFDVFSTAKGSRPFPLMTEAERDLIGSPNEGLFIWNTDTNQLNNYNGTEWGAVAGSGGGGNITEWTANNIYAANDFVYDPDSDNILRAQQAFTSTGSIDFANWFVEGPSIAGTTNQITVTSLNGTYTLSAPQDLTPSADFEVNTLNLEKLSSNPATPTTGMVLYTMDGDNNSIFSRDEDGTITDYSIAITPTSAYCVVAMRENTNVAGDNLVDDAWESRTLNYIDPSSDCSFLGLNTSLDQITITQTGTYRAKWKVPFLSAGFTKTRLIDVGNGDIVLNWGINGSNDAHAHTGGMTQFTVTGAFARIIELQSYVTAGGGAGQGGGAMNLAGAPEQYQHIRIEKVQP